MVTGQKGGLLKTESSNDVLNTGLAGFVASPNTPITSSDTILTAFDKTQAQLNSIGVGPFVKTDGTTPLTGNWAAGNFYISAQTIGINTDGTIPIGSLQVAGNLTSTIRGIVNDQYSTDTLSAKIYNRKARGTFASPSTIITGDVISNWTSSAYDGTSFVDTADTRILSAGTISTGIIPSQMMFRTTNSLGTLTQALTIDENQNISVGNINPVTGMGRVIHLYNTSNVATSADNASFLAQSVNRNSLFIARTSATGTSSFQHQSNDGLTTYGSMLWFALGGSHVWQINSDNTQKLAIDTTGFFSLGTVATPTALLDVNGVSTAFSKTAWTTNGTILRIRPFTITDTNSSGTVPAQYVNVFGAPTIAASSTTAYTLSANTFIAGPTAGTNVTQTNTAALVLGGNLYFNASATVVVGTFDAQTLSLRTNNTTRQSITSAGAFTFSSSAFSGTQAFMTFTPGTSSSGTSSGLIWTGAPHTGQTASTEIIDINYALNRTITWSTGALTTQRFFLVQAPTIAFAGASTVTQAATFVISAAPIAGANATITESNAFWVQSGQSRFDGAIKIIDNNIILSTVTGTILGTSTTQKLSFWNKTPVVQPTTSITASTFAANTSGILNDTATWDSYTIGKVVAALRQVGILA
jgi:hypothetical protein